MRAPVRRRAELSRGPLARYRRILEFRLVEDQVKKLFGRGPVPGTTHTAQGQKAVAVALAAASGVDDAVTCTYRGLGAQVTAGEPLVSAGLDKADVDVPSPVTGTLVSINAETGAQVAVGDVICAVQT